MAKEGQHEHPDNAQSLRDTVGAVQVGQPTTGVVWKIEYKPFDNEIFFFIEARRITDGQIINKFALQVSEFTQLMDIGQLALSTYTQQMAKYRATVEKRERRRKKRRDDDSAA